MSPKYASPPNPLSALLIFALSSSFVVSHPLDLEPRQDASTATPTSTTTASAGTSPTSSSAAAPNGGMSKGLIIPLAAVLAGAIVVAFLIKYRARILKLFGRHPTSSDTSLQPLTAEVLAGSRRGRGVGGVGTGARGTHSTSGTGGVTTNATTSGANRTATAGRAAAARGRRGRGAAVRRTESGRSVKTLPEYTKDAGDEELVLVRRRSGSMSDDSFIEEEDEGTTGAIMAADDLAETGQSRSVVGAPQAEESNPRTSTDITSPVSENSGNPTRTPSTTRRSWGAAPTYLEAMSSPNPDDTPPQSADVPEPRRTAALTATNTIRRTASGIRDLLSRPFGPTAFRAPSTFAPNSNSGGQSSTQMHQTGGGRSRAESQSSLLHPTTSRFSTVSGSTYNSPWASTASLLISPPVPNSARRASFVTEEMPRKGLSDQQMKFLSSREAVDLVGIRLDDPPSGKRRRGSTSAFLGVDGGNAGLGQGLGQATPGSSRSRSRASSIGWAELSGEDLIERDERPPPTWEELDSERRRNEAAERRDLARPISRDERGEVNDDEQEGNDRPETNGVESDVSGKGTGTGANMAAGSVVEEVGWEQSSTSREDQGGRKPPATATQPFNVDGRPVAPKLAIPTHLAPDVQVEPPTPVSRPDSRIA